MIGEDVIVRNPKHLRFVASLPCIVTGSTECHAHHLLKGTSEKGMGIKAGDDKAVPLDYRVHDLLHRHGDETEFFLQYGIKDPVGIARALYLSLHPWDAEEYIQTHCAPLWVRNRKALYNVMVKAPLTRKLKNLEKFV
jgi:hypothetical protein